ncbi:16S rRNA (guanine(527)-N(7))-methyltransferase RsmG [Janibacter limosus]|uniref:16S rRNA (guanine(527)-N(7))-methyltransferase RsmG n=1 Tax=Janibacter limosus TaxID=53458 RepID=UPI00082AC17D|nr:16S rRNA (guanine(527)-N(7))-methyltransferase RsmG [Janibacter limosus]
MTVEIPPAPEGAHRFFGGRLPRAEAFVAILADTGVSHGLIGPREVPILWERHVLNCAVIEDAFAADSRVIDVGSGAGLPGIGVAIVRPDLDVHLVEPMLRRTEWLSSTVEQLALDNVTVHRGRAEEFHDQLSAPYVTARAVARLDKLARWCLPLVERGGSMVAMKGRSAPEELTAATKVLRRLGVTHSQVSTHGEGFLSEPTLTVNCSKGARSS